MNFLNKELMNNLIKAEDLNAMIRRLESTWYGPEIERAASMYSGPELLEVAMNRHIVETNRVALQVTPFSRKAAIQAYLSKWDIYNIELILSSKAIGRTITETEPFLVSSRNFPAGITAGNISHDEMKIILAQPTFEGVVNQLVKYKYGVILIQHLDTYQKTGNLSPMIADLMEFYYTNLLDMLKFYQGDEGTIRDLVRTQMDKKNILTIMKAKESNLDREIVKKHLISGGNISVEELLDIYGTNNISELSIRIDEILKLGDLLEYYKNSNSLIDFEVALDKYIHLRYIRKLKNIALSIGSIFYFILKAETEWDNVKRIAYGKRYGFSEERINSMLILEG
jgi:V/A-type H+/Na+-transporting ATPase subunit C